MTQQAVARKALPEIRRKETLAAGRILGIGKHYFLEQIDAGFTLDANEGPRQLWDTDKILSVLTKLLTGAKYQFVLILLPTSETHGHHQAAAWLALKAIAALPAEARPAVLGGDPGLASVPPSPFTANPELPITAVWPGAPVFTFDRNTSFGFNHELNYQIVVNYTRPHSFSITKENWTGTLPERDHRGSGFFYPAVMFSGIAPAFSGNPCLA